LHWANTVPARLAGRIPLSIFIVFSRLVPVTGAQIRPMAVTDQERLSGFLRI
jgi:hypothetical protein